MHQDRRKFSFWHKMSDMEMKSHLRWLRERDTKLQQMLAKIDTNTTSRTGALNNLYRKIWGTDLPKEANTKSLMLALTVLYLLFVLAKSTNSFIESSSNIIKVSKLKMHVEELIVRQKELEIIIAKKTDEDVRISKKITKHIKSLQLQAVLDVLIKQHDERTLWRSYNDVEVWKVMKLDMERWITELEIDVASLKANAAYGLAMPVNQDCKRKFFELKAKQTYRFITFKIEETEDNQKQLIVDKIGAPTLSYEDLIASLPEEDCRYAIYNYKKDMIIFYTWSPEASKPASKLLYANSKDHIKREFDGVYVVLQAVDLSSPPL